MIVRLTPEDSPRLDEVEDFTGFKAVAPAGDDLRALARKCGLVDAGGAHLWVDPNWLLSQRPNEDAWRESLAGMIGYAESKGWLDASGRVRAHIEIEG